MITRAIKSYENDRLKVLDIQAFNYAVKAKCAVQKYIDDNNHGEWKFFYYYFIAQHDGKPRTFETSCG